MLQLKIQVAFTPQLPFEEICYPLSLQRDAKIASLVIRFFHFLVSQEKKIVMGVSILPPNANIWILLDSPQPAAQRANTLSILPWPLNFGYKEYSLWRLLRQ